MTTAGFLSGTNVHDAPTRRARGASLTALLLGVSLLVLLPALGDAAGYVAVLAGVSATAALAGACALWVRPGLLAHTVTGIAAVTVVVVEGLRIGGGLPGAMRVDRLTALEGGLVLGLAVVVLLLLAADLLRRPAQRPSEHPYAL